MKSFLKIENPEFSIHNIPFGVFERKGTTQCATRLGNFVIDLAFLFESKLITLESENVFQQPNLNKFINLGKKARISTRSQIQNLFSENSKQKEKLQNLQKFFMFDINQVTMKLPCHVGDYTDFYSSKNHAINVGTMFRGKENALKENWLWLPVGYHGRSSSVVVSPQQLQRPSGQKRPQPGQRPPFGKSNKMDFELEMVTVIGKNNDIGSPVDIKNAWDHIFGYLVMNDVSARDLQAWEYIPLGPFTGKNLMTVVSCWIVTPEALEPFRVKLEKQDPVPHDYLLDSNHSSYDLPLEVLLQSEKMKEPERIALSNFKYLYWNPAQQLTHHTVTGCNLQVGDFLGSGTISGKEKSEYGSFLELSWNGKEEIGFSNGEKRKFWEDGDKVILRARAEKGGVCVGFGECVTTLVDKK